MVRIEFKKFITVVGFALGMVASSSVSFAAPGKASSNNAKCDAAVKKFDAQVADLTNQVINFRKQSEKPPKGFDKRKAYNKLIGQLDSLAATGHKDYAKNCSGPLPRDTLAKINDLQSQLNKLK